MGYRYEDIRARLFTDDGQRLLLKVRDRAFFLIHEGGAARMQEIVRTIGGDSWEQLAALDRLVELGDLVEVPNPSSGVGQHRIFTRYA